jgi:hypothetical protein
MDWLSIPHIPPRLLFSSAYIPLIRREGAGSDAKPAKAAKENTQKTVLREELPEKQSRVSPD